MLDLVEALARFEKDELLKKLSSHSVMNGSNVGSHSVGFEEFGVDVQTLDININVHGPYHSSVSTSYNNMATVYESEGKHEEALALLNNVEVLKKLEAMKRLS
ncbi:hypothetical protein T484DRAFT_1816649 [Baffinella frigidus]|nr:hypothetical protein T484DRAFT_1816649 [Cryptophyta sp. CCMP2293]